MLDFAGKFSLIVISYYCIYGMTGYACGTEYFGERYFLVNLFIVVPYIFTLIQSARFIGKLCMLIFSNRRHTNLRRCKSIKKRICLYPSKLLSTLSLSYYYADQFFVRLWEFDGEPTASISTYWSLWANRRLATSKYELILDVFITAFFVISFKLLFECALFFCI